MSYDPNSLQVKKGALGEKIVRELLETLGCEVKKPADTFKSGASIVDFDCGEFYVEVKTQIARPFGPEKAPCYSFPTSRINAYKDYDPLELWIVDPESGFAYHEDLTELERPVYIDARLYPFDRRVENMGGDFHYWHRDQFSMRFPIPPDDLAELKKLFDLSEPATQPQTDKPKSLVEQLAKFVNVGKAELIQAVLDLRQAKFDREQAQMKELLA